ncbi:hypothetical protein K438DRAFT_1875856 [Mycena galopus ATCC 62051]|nr:hypothetical protein K438DRAFT_1875856 [Mycena galopus ATCC 62051]
MRFTAPLLLPTLISVVFAAATVRAGPSPDDVYVPTITSPTAGTVWQSNSLQTITWDTSNAPANISNRALLFLRQNGNTAPFILAKDFDLRAGSLNITVPYVVSNNNYQWVLFGDSGDFSPVMTIQSDII